MSEPLTPDEIRHLLSECVTVVKPGETLVVQVPMDTEPRIVREIQDALDTMSEWRNISCAVLVVPGTGMAVAEPGSDEVFARRVMNAINRMAVRASEPGYVSAQPKYLGEDRGWWPPEPD